MAVFLTAILTALLLTGAPAPALAQCGNAYTDMESAGPGGTYGSSAACSDEVPTPGEAVGEGVPATVDVSRPLVTGNDAPPVDRGTATFEGESEPAP